MKRIALKIDVDTCQGAQYGVPALIDALRRQEAAGSFFFALGPDRSGREDRASSLVRYYGWRSRLNGKFLPSPDIGKHCAQILRETKNAGFEVGIHAWDRMNWEMKIGKAENAWVEEEMAKACARFSEIFSEIARCHAAAGWRMNRHALRLTQRLGFTYASDCRGNRPFLPVIDGELVNCPQIPTTLPTLDETLVTEAGATPEQAADRIVELSADLPGDHVFTLRAELEGMKFTDAFERMIAGWKDKGYRLVGLRDIHATLDIKQLPRHAVHFAEIPGRPGPRMTQGPEFP